MAQRTNSSFAVAFVSKFQLGMRAFQPQPRPVQQEPPRPDVRPTLTAFGVRHAEPETGAPAKAG